MADKKINGSLEITGKLNPNASGYGFNLPSSDSLTADKTIATEKYVDSALLSKADLVNGLVPAAQLPSYVDDVLESSDAGHFPSAGEKGKIYVALDTGFTYRWSGSEYVQIGGQDLSNFVTLDTEQTITGVKTFSSSINLSSTYGRGTTYSIESDDSFGQLRIAHDDTRLLTVNDAGIMPNGTRHLGNSSYPWKDLYLSGKCCTNDIDSSDNMFFGKTGYTQYARGILASASNGLYDLGRLSNKWKDLYLSGNISDGTNSVSVADIANSTFNVINASDIVNNTLTQEQYDLVTNGKPTLIKGVFLSGYTNFVLFPPLERAADFIFEAQYTTAYPAFVLGLVSLNKTTKVISLNTNKFYRGEQFDSISSSKFNSKTVPAYPSDTGTFNLKQLNGALTWTEEWYGTQAEYDALGTYDDNTIYNITEE